MDPADTPERVGSIRIDGVLGEGGMGTVYIGFDETLQRKVALKSIRADRRLGAVATKRFLREARTLSQLEHRGICRIHGYEEQDGCDYLVLEYVEGATLGRHIQSGSLTGRHRLRIARQIADALAAAHAKGIVHRDLKPDNVMITPDGQVKVLDFGLARHADAPAAGAGDSAGPADGTGTGGAGDPDSASPGGSDEGSVGSAGSASTFRTGGSDGSAFTSLVTEAGRVVGTPLFMSPEQARGGRVSTASDMYSFGLLLQTLWSGRSPYPEGVDGRDIMRMARRARSLAPSGMPAPISALIERLKVPAPAARATAVETLERLRWIEDRPARWLRRGLGAALLLIAVGVAVKYTLDLDRERSLAEQERNIANQRRGQAEQLLRFLADDLRDKLRAVGRLDILDDVDAKAMEYYAAVPETELSPGELNLRAQGLYQIGEVRIEQGDLAAAMDAFRRSLALSAQLVRQAPDDAQARVRLGYAYYWIGDGSFQQGDLAAALSAFESSRDVAQELVELEPDNPEWRLELASEESNIARVYQAQGDREAATDMLRQRLRTVTDIAASDPGRADWQVELASSHLILGDALEQAGEFEGALAQYRADADIMTMVVASDPRNVQWLDRLSTSHSYLGTVLRRMGDTRASTEQFAAQQEIADVLAGVDAASSRFRDSLASGLGNVSVIRRTAGDLDAASEAASRALAIYTELSTQDPTRARWLVSRARCHVELGWIHQLLGEHRSAQDKARSALDIVAPLLAATDANGPAFESASVATRAQLLTGCAFAQQGEAAEARGAWEQSLALQRQFSHFAERPNMLALRARALLRLGRHAEAAPVLAKLKQQGHVAPLLTRCLEQTAASGD
ncbi:MAG: hypothetical protein DRQ55_07080 [Planctomycetota bacterium]|nr:MAG: hypothetical protein DRQ55_07080 [Planctomycetota bacterium]